MLRVAVAYGCRPSLIAGWDLICICLCFFPPSLKFYHYLNGVCVCVCVCVPL
jgi:hypothetical protein